MCVCVRAGGLGETIRIFRRSRMSGGIGRPMSAGSGSGDQAAGHAVGGGGGDGNTAANVAAAVDSADADDEDDEPNSSKVEQDLPAPDTPAAAKEAALK